MAFMLSEDKALRELLQGLTVSDQKSENEDIPRAVGVWFGMPDQELRAQSYPYITIDMIDIQRDTTREMRGKTSAEYLRPEGFDPESRFELDRPIPVDIDYQITTYARHPRHDRELLTKVLFYKLPMRLGTLQPDDNTVRRLEVLNVTKRDITEQQKRLFMNAITVRVSSEISAGLFRQLYQVLSVHIDDPTPERAGGRNSVPYFEGMGGIVITAN